MLKCFSGETYEEWKLECSVRDGVKMFPNTENAVRHALADRKRAEVRLKQGEQTAKSRGQIAHTFSKVVITHITRFYCSESRRPAKRSVRNIHSTGMEKALCDCCRCSPSRCYPAYFLSDANDFRYHTLKEYFQIEYILQRRIKKKYSISYSPMRYRLRSKA